MHFSTDPCQRTTETLWQFRVMYFIDILSVKPFCNLRGCRNAEISISRMDCRFFQIGSMVGFLQTNIVLYISNAGRLLVPTKSRTAEYCWPWHMHLPWDCHRCDSMTLGDSLESCLGCYLAVLSMCFFWERRSLCGLNASIPIPHDSKHWDNKYKWWSIGERLIRHLRPSFTFRDSIWATREKPELCLAHLGCSSGCGVVCGSPREGRLGALLESRDSAEVTVPLLMTPTSAKWSISKRNLVHSSATFDMLRKETSQWSWA